MTKWILLLVLYINAAAVGQTISDAKLVDEFSKYACDELMARVDNFAVQLNQNPSSRGYVVIGGRNALLRGKVGFELTLEAAMQERLANRSRLEIVHIQEAGDFKVQFWIAGADSNLEAFKPTKWNFALAEGTKPFVIKSDYGEMCGTALNLNVINDFLNSNPGMKVHVVVMANTKRDRQALLTDVRSSLKNIDARRLRYFFAKAPGYTIATAEYWLVPMRH